jgi:hypothetical protein
VNERCGSMGSWRRLEETAIRRVKLRRWSKKVERGGFAGEDVIQSWRLRETRPVEKSPAEMGLLGG